MSSPRLVSSFLSPSRIISRFKDLGKAMDRCCPCLAFLLSSKGEEHDKLVISSPYQSTAKVVGANSLDRPVGRKEGVVRESLLPSWVEDEDAPRCYGCGAAFDVLNRRHHCRYCRNIFCGHCARKDQPAYLLGLNGPTRFCTRCESEVATQNRFVKRHLTMLLRGANFNLSRGLLSQKATMTLLLSPDLLNVELRDPSCSPRNSDRVIQIPFSTLQKVHEDGAQSLKLVARDKSYSLQATSTRMRDEWITALQDALSVLPVVLEFGPRVEQERLQRKMQEESIIAETAYREAQAQRKAEKSRARNEIAAKYSLPQRY